MRWIEVDGESWRVEVAGVLQDEHGRSVAVRVHRAERRIEVSCFARGDQVFEAGVVLANGVRERPRLVPVLGGVS